MQADFARQRQQRQRKFQVDFERILAARQAGAFGLFAFRLRRKLDIRPETAVMQADIAPGFRIDAQTLASSCGGLSAPPLVNWRVWRQSG